MNDTIAQQIDSAEEKAPEVVETASKAVEAVKPDQKVEEVKETKTAAPKKVQKERSEKYKAARAMVDKTKKYSVAEAIKLIKKMSYTKFDGSLEAHLVVKEAGISAKVDFPHTTGKSIKVAMVNADVIKQIEAGNIDFDVLIATPADMPKITKFARTLGPKGLMPNPKNGTLTPNPELKKKELESGTVTVKTERKAPLVHIALGKLSQDDAELEANFLALIKAFKTKLKKVSLAGTMSPSVKVDIAELLEK
jgi:large subunit ribosomal protein L1